MSNKGLKIYLFVALFALLMIVTESGRGGRRGGKGKGKNNLNFHQVAEFSLIQERMSDNRVNIDLSYKLFKLSCLEC
jgi:hypothetical protein